MKSIKIEILHGDPDIFLMVLLVDNICQIPKGVQNFVLLKGTENEIQAAFPEFKCPGRPKTQLYHCKQRGMRRQQNTAI